MAIKPFRFQTIWQRLIEVGWLTPQCLLLQWGNTNPGGQGYLSSINNLVLMNGEKQVYQADTLLSPAYWRKDEDSPEPYMPPGAESEVNISGGDLSGEALKHNLTHFYAFSWNYDDSAIYNGYAIVGAGVAVNEGTEEEPDNVVRVRMRAPGGGDDFNLFAWICKQDRDAFPDYFAVSGSADVTVEWNLTEDTVTMTPP